MQIKSVTLYSLPSVVGIAGILVAVHQVVPTPKTISLWDANANDGTFSGQTVNRPRKERPIANPEHNASGPREGPDKYAGENPRNHYCVT